MIEVKRLVKDYGPIRAVDGVSFKVNKGDVLGFLGPNGAGKSTTMKMVTGFLSPTSGTASIGGHDIIESPLEARKLFGYLPESCPLYPEMTVLEFLGFIAEMRGFSQSGEQKKAISRVLDICHLEAVRHQPIDTLSKGYRQRVGMAQAILHDPACLIMDEPTDGLDPNQKQEVRKLIASMAEEKAMILSTHILEEVEAMCTRIIIIAHGKILVDETPGEFRKRHPRHHAIRLLPEKDDTSAIREALGKVKGISEVIPEEGDTGALIALPKNGSPIEPEILALVNEKGWKLQSFDKPPIRLEEVFSSLTQKKD